MIPVQRQNKTNLNNINEEMATLDEKTTSITEYDLNNYKTDVIATITRNNFQVKNGAVYISAYLTTQAAISADLNTLFFTNIPSSICPKKTVDFVIKTESGIVGRGIIGGRSEPNYVSKINFRFDEVVGAGKNIIFNFSYLIN